MSTSEPSEKLCALIFELREEIGRASQAGKLTGLAPDCVTHLLGGAVKLYAAAAEDAESGIGLPAATDSAVSTTEAIVVACALFRAHHLNPFDLALWFSRTALDRGSDARDG